MGDALGDRMKDYERRETGRRFLPMLPIYARIDGRSFSRFTKGMNRPFDQTMSNIMLFTTEYLVEETNALIGYTQSDEISLIFYQEHSDSEVFFNGKIFKMTSQLAAMATAKFNALVVQHFPDRVKLLPTFDARVFTLPNKVEAANAILWREFDATKNAISMAARSVCSHKELQGKSGNEMQEMMFQKGVNFNDYPSFFKRGTYVRRIRKERELTDLELAKIPEQHRPTGPVERVVVEPVFGLPPFNTVTNRVGFIFNGEDPLTN